MLPGEPGDPRDVEDVSWANSLLQYTDPAQHIITADAGPR